MTTVADKLPITDEGRLACRLLELWLQVLSANVQLGACTSGRLYREGCLVSIEKGGRERVNSIDRHSAATRSSGAWEPLQRLGPSLSFSVDLNP